jgi:hypothetical protein
MGTRSSPEFDPNVDIASRMVATEINMAKDTHITAPTRFVGSNGPLGLQAVRLGKRNATRLPSTLPQRPRKGGRFMCDIVQEMQGTGELGELIASSGKQTLS